MNLQNLNNDELLESTQNEFRLERVASTNILRHLIEIHRRRLYSELRYESLFDMLVKYFGCSEPQAYQRLNAMRLISELPEIEDKVIEGQISMTNIALAEKLSGASVRSARKLTLELSSIPEEQKPDRIRDLPNDKCEFNFQGPMELQEKIKKLKGLLAHKNPDMSLGELIDQLCDLGIKHLNPGKKVVTSAKRCTIKPKAEIRREVFRKANNRCESCGSHYALEIDHIIPQAKGGLTIEENLRLLCRSCNQLAAIKAFGAKKMRPYLSG